MTLPRLTLRPAACGTLVSVVAANGSVLATVPRDCAKAARAALQAPPKAEQRAGDSNVIASFRKAAA